MVQQHCFCECSLWLLITAPHAHERKRLMGRFLSFRVFKCYNVVVFCLFWMWYVYALISWPDVRVYIRRSGKRSRNLTRPWNHRCPFPQRDIRKSNSQWSLTLSSPQLTWIKQVHGLKSWKKIINWHLFINYLYCIKEKVLK